MPNVKIQSLVRICSLDPKIEKDCLDIRAPMMLALPEKYKVVSKRLFLGFPNNLGEDERW